MSALTEYLFSWRCYRSLRFELSQGKPKQDRPSQQGRGGPRETGSRAKEVAEDGTGKAHQRGDIHLQQDQDPERSMGPAGMAIMVFQRDSPGTETGKQYQPVKQQGKIQPDGKRSPRPVLSRVSTAARPAITEDGGQAGSHGHGYPCRIPGRA